MYTIIKAVKDVVVYSQTTYESTAMTGLRKLALLGTDVLEPNEPLEVLHVQPIGQFGDAPEPTERQHTQLTKTAVATREAFLDALAWRFVRPRYGTGLQTHSHLYDVAHFLTPGAKKMMYLPAIKRSTLGQRGGFVEEVKANIVQISIYLMDLFNST